MAEEQKDEIDSMNSQMDATNLYSEEVVTDRKVGTIRVLTPVTPEGHRDAARQMVFLGEAQIMTQMGPIPISFEIPAQTVAEAVSGYGEAAKQGLRDTIEKLRALRRDAANQIVTPDMPGFQAPPADGSGSGLGGSGLVMP